MTWPFFTIEISSDLIFFLAAVFTIIASVIAIIAAFRKVRKERQDKQDKRAQWVADICDKTFVVGRSMGIGQMDLVLDSIYAMIQGNSGGVETPNKGLVEIDNTIDKELKGISNLLNTPIISKEIVDHFKKELDRILNQYFSCRRDLGLVIDLCFANDREEAERIMREGGDGISTDLKRAIDAAFDKTKSFSRNSFIIDVIGIRFVDCEIPDYKLMLEQLARWLHETVISKPFSVTPSIDRRYKYRNSPESSFEMAERFFDEKSFDEAFKWYEKAATSGLPAALFKLGECYENGEGCETNPVLAAECYEKAAERGLPIAEYRIGRCYENGYGCEQSFSNAFYYYKRSAKKGYSEAIYSKGLCLWHGRGIVGNKKEAIKLIEKAAEKGSIIAQRSLCSYYFTEDNEDKFAIWTKALAESGDVEGMGYYGYYLLHSDKHRPVESLPWLEKSALGGDVISLFNLGVYYEVKGIDGSNQLLSSVNPALFSKAASWYEKAAVRGDAGAQYRTGQYYMLGFGVKKDTKKAEQWFQRAIHNGFIWATEGLGFLRHNSENYSEAVDFFSRAAAVRNPKACLMLSMYYREGYGVSVDKAIAEEFVNKYKEYGEFWSKRFESTGYYASPFDSQFLPPGRRFFSTLDRAIGSSLILEFEFIE